MGRGCWNIVVLQQTFRLGGRRACHKAMTTEVKYLMAVGVASDCTHTSFAGKDRRHSNLTAAGHHDLLACCFDLDDVRPGHSGIAFVAHDRSMVFEELHLGPSMMVAATRMLTREQHIFGKIFFRCFMLDTAAAALSSHLTDG